MRFRLLASLLVTALAAPAGFAVSYGFEAITHNRSLDVAIGEDQLQLEVEDAGAGIVRFAFANNGPASSSVTDIYFDSPTGLLGGMGIIDADQRHGDPGVDFSKGATPGNLPAANLATPHFQVSRGLSADSDPPVQRNGINPGELLVLLFNLRNQSDFDDVIASLDSGALRVGIHVQGFASGGSESFVNAPAIPEPNTAVLSAIATGCVGASLRRRRPSR